MKFVACVKLTPDTEQLTEVRPQGWCTGDLGVTMVMNPWDEFAVEEALALRSGTRRDGSADRRRRGIHRGAQEAVAMGVEEAVLGCSTRPSRAATHGAGAYPGSRPSGSLAITSSC